MSGTTNKPISGSGMIAVERAEQIFKHGRGLNTDQRYYSRDVFQRAAVAILHQNAKEWPDHDMPVSLFKKIMRKSKPEQIAIAGALLAAMIDYMNFNNEHTSGIEMGEEYQIKVICEIDNLSQTVTILPNIVASTDNDKTITEHIRTSHGGVL